MAQHTKPDHTTLQHYPAAEKHGSMTQQSTAVQRCWAYIHQMHYSQSPVFQRAVMSEAFIQTLSSEVCVTNCVYVTVSLSSNTLEKDDAGRQQTQRQLFCKFCSGRIWD